MPIEELAETRRWSVAFLIALTGAAALSACDQPKPRTPKPTPPPIFATPQPLASARSGPPMPALPAWSAEMIGKPLATLFPGKHPFCMGNTDNVQEKYGGVAPGVQIVGWGWDPAAKAPIARILLTDNVGLVAGAGESGVARRDVIEARPDITSLNTGWAAYTSRTMGPVEAYGVIDGGRALCRLGHLDF
jgi:hypothetical protein